MASSAALLVSPVKTHGGLLNIHYNNDCVLVSTDTFTLPVLEDFIRSQWQLEADQYYLTTNELDICRGRSTRIDPSAWLLIKDIVGNVYIAGRADQSLKARPRYSTTSTARVSMGLTTIDNDRGRTAEVDDEDEVEQETRSEGQGSGYVVVEERVASAVSMDTSSQTPRSSRRPGTEQPDDPLHLFDDELSADHFSNGRKNAAEEEEEEEEVAASTDAYSRPSSTATSVQERSPSAAEVLRHLRREQSSTRSDSESTVVNREPEQPPSSACPQTDRIIIVMEFPELGFDQSMFRARSEHTVAKVLKGASKNLYKVDPSRVALKMVIEDEEGTEHFIKCDNGQTIGSLGILDHQRFIVTLKDEDELEH